MQWLGTELTATNRNALYVPEGFAHGYKTLVDKTEVFYQVSQYYSPGYERGVRWDDPVFGIDWPETAKFVISDKDKHWPNFEG
jgi:dTDP-4-dehydrorhamnose 3,5-epimerase